jgi:3-deoxy-D-manno-octulosonic-acid transferase
MDAQRFLAIGADPEKLKVTGNMKFDLANPPSRDAEARQAIEDLGWKGLPLLVAGSTHPGEERTVLKGWLEVRKTFKELRVVIAPRHTEKVHKTAALLKEMKVPYALCSGGPSIGVEALILDGHGLLPSFYAQALASFVGGTLVPVGGHNLLEPALLGCPVIFGPFTSHTEQSAKALEESGGGLRVSGADSITRVLVTLLSKPEQREDLSRRAREAAMSLAGATGRTFSHLEAILGVV